MNGRELLVRSPEGRTDAVLPGRGSWHRGRIASVTAPTPWDGQQIQTALTEPERGNALHGLVSFQLFSPVTVAEDELVLSTQLFPSTGYPFHLVLSVHYALDPEEGLTTTVTARNLGEQDAPYGVCPHPYLVAGPEPLDTWSLQMDAGTVLTVTEDRLLPTGTEQVSPGGEFDFRSPATIGDLFIDHAFTDLGRDEKGRFRVTVTAPGGTGVELSAGPELPWLQVHTGDRPEPENHRQGLAVEPMTCPPDAFRSGTDVVRLAPGAEHAASWALRGW